MNVYVYVCGILAATEEQHTHHTPSKGPLLSPKQNKKKEFCSNPQEEQKQNEVKGIKCPKGHDLKQQVMVDDSYHW